MPLKDFFSRLFGTTKQTTIETLDKIEEMTDKTIDKMEVKSKEAMDKANAWTQEAMHDVKESTNEAMTKMQESEIFKKAEDAAQTAWAKTKEMGQDIVEGAQQFAEKTADSLDDLADRMKSEPTDSNKSSTANNTSDTPGEATEQSSDHKTS